MVPAIPGVQGCSHTHNWHSRRQDSAITSTSPKRCGQPSGSGKLLLKASLPDMHPFRNSCQLCPSLLGHQMSQSKAWAEFGWTPVHSNHGFCSLPFPQPSNRRSSVQQHDRHHNQLRPRTNRDHCPQGHVTHTHHAAQPDYLTGYDNVPTVAWLRKGSLTSCGLVTHLLQL